MQSGTGLACLATEDDDPASPLLSGYNSIKTENMTESAFSTMWDGYCPESLLMGKCVRMRLNQHDYFESEETGLQICLIPGVQAVVLRFRGQGKFKATPTFGDKVEQGELLSPQNSDRTPFNNPVAVFAKREDMAAYIVEIAPSP